MAKAQVKVSTKSSKVSSFEIYLVFDKKFTCMFHTTDGNPQECHTGVQEECQG